MSPLSTLATFSSTAATYIILHLILHTTLCTTQTTHCTLHTTHYILHTTHFTLISEDWTLHQVAGDYGCLYSSWMLLHCLEDSARDPLSDHQVISSKASQHTTALQDLMLEPEVEEAFREMAAYR